MGGVVGEDRARRPARDGKSVVTGVEMFNKKWKAARPATTSASSCAALKGRLGRGM
jgi:hypothetical protein